MKKESKKDSTQKNHKTNKTKKDYVQKLNKNRSSAALKNITLVISSFTLAFMIYEIFMKKIDINTQKIINLEYKINQIQWTAQSHSDARIDSILTLINQLKSETPTTNSKMIVPPSDYKQEEIIDVLNDNKIMIKVVQILPYDDWIKLQISVMDSDSRYGIITEKAGQYSFNYENYSYTITFWGAKVDSLDQPSAKLSISRFHIPK